MEAIGAADARTAWIKKVTPKAKRLEANSGRVSLCF